MVKFINWWDTLKKEYNPQDDWFQLFFISCCKDYQDSDINKICMYSLFGSDDNYNNVDPSCVNLFFYGENILTKNIVRDIDSIMTKMDGILGFFLNTSKSIRLPLWCIYHNYQKDGLFIPIYNNNRTNKAVIVANHDINGKRQETINKLVIKNIGVDSNKPYKFSNTNGITIGEGSIGKISSIKDYKYNICCENSLTNGYTTEKCFESLTAGCIPIYYGDNPVEPKVLFQDNIVYVDNMDYIEQKVFDRDKVWKPDALIYIYTTYLKIWSIVLKKMGWRHIKPEKIIEYKCNTKEEALNIFVYHWIKYNNFNTPRAKVILGEEILWMENVVDDLYNRYSL